MTATNNPAAPGTEAIAKKVYPPRNPLLRVLQILYSIYAILLFIVLMLIVIVLLPFCLLFGKIQGGNLLYVLLKYWAVIWYFFIGIRHREIYEAPYDKTKQYIFVANHISYMDIPAAVRSLHQPVRILGKHDMLSYPIFGLIYRLAVIVVDRRSAEARAQSVRAMKAALDKHISIFIFPEGTFNETEEVLKEFYDGAFRIAIETGTPIKPILFADTHKRMHYRGLFEFTPGRNLTVYLPEVMVDTYGMKGVGELKTKVHSMMKEGLLRYGQKRTSNEFTPVTKQ